MENTTDVLIRQLKAVNKKIGVDWDKIKEYKPNSIYQDGDVYALSYASQLIYEQHESLGDIYEDIWEMEYQLEEMADYRRSCYDCDRNSRDNSFSRSSNTGLNAIKSIVYAAGGDDKTYSLLENVFAFAS